jgi:hypothetical protein
MGKSGSKRAGRVVQTRYRSYWTVSQYFAVAVDPELGCLTLLIRTWRNKQMLKMMAKLGVYLTMKRRTKPKVKLLVK